MSPQSKAKARTKQKTRSWKGWALVRYGHTAAMFTALKEQGEVWQKWAENDNLYECLPVVITEQPTKARL